VRANFLASPPLVVAYALAGTVTEDITTTPIAQDREGADVINPNTRKGDVTIASDQQFAQPTAQGAAIRDDAEGHTTVDFACEKHSEEACRAVAAA